MLGQGKHQVPGDAECAPPATVPYTCEGSMASVSGFLMAKSEITKVDMGHVIGEKHALLVK